MGSASSYDFFLISFFRERFSERPTFSIRRNKEKPNFEETKKKLDEGKYKSEEIAPMAEV
jgi:hypothetical protein